MVVLKRLPDALNDGDRIQALIDGTACNQDGRSTNLTAPNGPSQEAVIRSALKDAEIDARQVSYLETHGTGTSLGDPMEAHALLSVYRGGNPAEHPLILGAVKTNLGHPEAAAGVAGFIKTVLCLEHKEIPRNLHFEKLSTDIKDEKACILVPVEHMPWRTDKGPRIAGLSSFGFSGTNVHMILGEAPEREEKSVEEYRPLHILTLSAKNEAALPQLADRYAQHLTRQSHNSIADFCYTANAGRAHFPIRRAFVTGSVEHARGLLGTLSEGKTRADVFSGDLRDTKHTEIAFLFTGQGSQYVGMGRQLYETQPVFRKTLERCDELLRPFLARPLLSMMYPTTGDEPYLNELAFTQPALFALEYALCELWRSWGVEPSSVMGHGLGEYPAACVAGVFSLEEGLKLTAQRARLVQQLPANGAMAAVFAAPSQIEKLLAFYKGQVSIAAINGPESIVLSGTSESVEAILSRLEEQGISWRPLDVSHAFHSALMDPILDEFEENISSVPLHTPSIELISNVTGEVISGEVTKTDYWRRHLRNTVHFAEGMRTLHDHGCRLFVEIGPNPVLLGMGRRCLQENGCSWLPSLKNGENDWRRILESLAEVYVRGIEVDWEGVDRTYSRRRLQIPTHPFQRERYWLEGTPEGKIRGSEKSLSLWESILAAGRVQSEQCPLDLELASYPEKWQILHELTIAQMIYTLQQLGVLTQPGEKTSVEAMIQKAPVDPKYRVLLSKWLQRLKQEGFLQALDGDHVSVGKIPEIDLQSIWQQVREALADTPVLLEYLDNCCRKLPAILKGEANPLDTIFPGGSFKIAEYIYRDWPVARYFASIIRNILDCIIGQQHVQRPLRLIEIGAGTGGTAAGLIPLLSRENTTYWFTDVSELFLIRAKESFKDYQFVKYGLLDIADAPQAQGYKSHSFDVVIAANVLHATRDLEKVLEHVNSLLAPGGTLLILETTKNISWFDITTGLLEGLNLHSDQWRQDYPFISEEKWKEILLSHGWEKAASFPETGSKAEILLQHVLVAQRPKEKPSQVEPVSFQAQESEENSIYASRGYEVTARPEGEPFEPQDFVARLEHLLPDERRNLLVEFVREHLMTVLRIDPGSPPHRRSRLMELGVDSLIAVEFAKRLERSLGQTHPFPATLVFDYPTIEAIADYVAEKVLRFDESPERTSEAVAITKQERRMSIGQLENLADEEVEALLLDKLKNI